MNVKLKVLTVGALFFIGGQAVMAQKKKDSLGEKKIEEVVIVGFGQKKTVNELTGAVGNIKADAIEKQYEILKAKIDSLPQAILHKAFKGELTEQLDSDGDARELLKEIEGLKTKVEKDKRKKSKDNP